MRPIDLVKKVAPGARADYLAAFDRGESHLSRFAIVNRRRFVHFLAQVCHETDGLTITVESLNYSAERMVEVWPSRFPDVASARPYAHAPERLANKVYARAELGNVRPGDGWAFIGRGMLQITGREAYEKYGAALGIDLAGNPTLAISAEWSLAIAAAEWAASKRKGRSCNQMADDDDIDGVTRAINGGLIGLSSRKAWLAKILRVLGDETLDLPAPGPTVAVREKPGASAVVVAGLAVAAAGGTATTTAPPPAGAVPDSPASVPSIAIFIGIAIALAAIGLIVRHHMSLSKE